MEGLKRVSSDKYSFELKERKNTCRGLQEGIKRYIEEGDVGEGWKETTHNALLGTIEITIGDELLDSYSSDQLAFTCSCYLRTRPKCPANTKAEVSRKQMIRDDN